ncbi:MAG: alanine dehydrogenase [Bacilli bacterium]
MIIGVPKEIKKLEYRVGLTPDAAKQYIQHGHQVLIQQDAGIGSGFANKEYLAEGCKILPTIQAIYAQAEMIIKVKEPLEEEFSLMRPNQILYTFLHLAAAKPLTDALLKQQVTGIAYETIQDSNGRLPVLRPMSEVAGRLAVQEGAKYLEKAFGGRGVLLGGIPGVETGHVVVLGANGYAGFNATQIALGMQAKVTAIDVKFNQVETLVPFGQGRLTLLPSNDANIRQALKTADLVVSTVLIPGDAAPKLIKRDDLKSMMKGSVIVDVAIDQGGSTETSKVTYHDQPIYEIDGVIHYCVANMPGAVPRTSTIGLNKATLPYGLAIADLGFKMAMLKDQGLAKGLNTYQGKLTYPALAKLFQLPSLTINEVLSGR